ncbi:IGF-like family receptor 1 [Acipenser ruthenus]|uniref:IGF-like family receptor 1 n=1 Tax=Acipenser ruthenus TaxID=7906 RepID=UPI0027427B49|nr:IGF-like family receptor 1 [Acipenser ruthenus]XP_058867221.1 IGF-like family receptor 1 [Acipenser ruthenus]
MKLRWESPVLWAVLLSSCLHGALSISSGRLYSKRCSYLSYWSESECRACEKDYPREAGKEYSPNCGIPDEGGRLTTPLRPCANGTYNTGTHDLCQPCSKCHGRRTLRRCSATRDTQCCGEGDCQPVCCWCSGSVGEESGNTECPHADFSCVPAEGTQCLQYQEGTTDPGQSTGQTPAGLMMMTSAHGTMSQTTPATRPYVWCSVLVILVVVVTGIVLSLVSKNHKQLQDRLDLAAHDSDGESELSPPSDKLEDGPVEVFTDKTLNEMLAPGLQEVPLQRVLDDLDVLEELVMLLDPESPNSRTTRHLAARCSFPATWINYTYSMRDSKSPLKAVLEAVSAKWPDWTVGQLARVLADMGRNDAVKILARLPPDSREAL